MEEMAIEHSWPKLNPANPSTEARPNFRPITLFYCLLSVEPAAEKHCVKDWTSFAHSSTQLIIYPRPPPTRCSRKCQNLKSFHALFHLLLSPQVGGGGDASHGQIEIFSLNRPVPRAVKSLLVGSAVRCLEYVPEPSPNEEAVAGSHKASSGLGAHICVGLDDGR